MNSAQGALGNGHRQEPQVKRQRSLKFSLYPSRAKSSSKASSKSRSISPTISTTRASPVPISPQLDSFTKTNGSGPRQGPAQRSASDDSYRTDKSIAQNYEGLHYRPSEASRLRLLNNAHTTDGRHTRDGHGPGHFPRPHGPSLRKSEESLSVARNASSSFPVPAETDSSVRNGFSLPYRDRGLSTSSYRSMSLHASAPLRPSTSIPEFASAQPLYSSQRNAMNYPGTRPAPLKGYSDTGFVNHRREPNTRANGVDSDEIRASFRSALTNTSSFFGVSGTERSSVLTKSSSTSIFGRDEGMSVDDAIGMYESGFADSGAEDGWASRPNTSLSHRSDSVNPPEQRIDSHARPPYPNNVIQDSTIILAEPEELLDDLDRELSPYSILTPKAVNKAEGWEPHAGQEPVDHPAMHPSLTYDGTRDRYGFRKKSQHVTLAEYEAWSTSYSEYLARRRKKWEALMKESGLSASQPAQFPSKSAKVKRFVRKGIPPNWRGAAWFWYAGGPSLIKNNPGLYDELVRKAANGGTNPTDEELIERDLNRTFPDNIKFKPDLVVRESGGMNRNSQQSFAEPETPTLQALRRVLQAFSIYNPKIGYCQSLNFLAGLLLLFMNEEKSFWLLNIITREYLPGTHEVNLEGANVDLGVLMTSIKESMPGIWAKIGGELDGSAGDSKVSMRLPPITLCCTAWFMSCFIGTLPIESTLRVWDSFFYEGSKTLFRIALAIFKVGEAEIKAVSDPMEIFQVVQTIPRRLVDASALMEACFRRRNGFGHLSQDTIETRRAERRAGYAHERAKAAGEAPNSTKGSIFSKMRGRERAAEGL